MRVRRVRKWTNEALITAVAQSNSYTGVLRRLGLRIAGGNHGTMRYWVDQLGLDTTHFRASFTDEAVAANTLDGSQVFCEHSKASRPTLKRFMRKGNEFPEVCVGCGNEGEWNNKPLKLQVDHINGIHDDNRKENLRWLCPNCHSQTDTYAGKKSWLN